jgi:hypothetical protein
MPGEAGRRGGLAPAPIPDSCGVAGLMHLGGIGPEMGDCWHSSRLNFVALPVTLRW